MTNRPVGHPGSRGKMSSLSLSRRPILNVVRQARRQIRKIQQARGRKLKSLLDKQLSNPRCKTREFCELYVEMSAETVAEDPKRGLLLSKFSIRFVERLHEDSRGELAVQALSSLGTALAYAGSLERAERIYRRALENASSHSEHRKAALLIRLSYLRSLQENPGSAHDLVSKAIALLETTGDPENRMPRALLRRGSARWELKRRSEAIDDLGHALLMADVKNDSRTYLAAIHNLGTAATESTNLEDIRTGLQFLSKAKKMLGGGRTTLPKAKLLWVQGKVVQRLGSTRLAETRFRSARHAANTLGAPYEFALISLDLAELLMVEGQWEELEHLVRDTRLTFDRISDDVKTSNTLKLWQEAIEARTFGWVAAATLRQRLKARKPSCCSNW